MSYNINNNNNASGIKNKNNLKDNNNLNFGVINPYSNAIKDNILNDLENNNIGNGNYSIDYIRGKKSKLNSNINLSGCFPVKLGNDENNLEDINKNEKMDKSMHRTKSAKKMMNLNSNNIEKVNEKTIFFENVNKVLLYPYFLPRYTKNIKDITIKNIEDAIEVYTHKKNFKFQCQDKDHVFIISKRQGHKFDNITQKRIYLLPRNKTDNFGLNINNSYNSNNNNINIRNEKYIDNAFTKDESIDNIDLNTINNNNSNNLNKSNNTEIHNSVNSISKNPEETKLIKDCFILCYTNKNRISKEKLNLLDKIFVDEDNKLFFAKLILPDTKIKKTKNY